MKRIFSALLAAATLFAGCTKSDVDDTYVDGKVQLKLTSSIAPTRATDIAFEDGDFVGLYITKGEEALKTNEKMTAYASGAIEAASPIYYPEDGAAIDLFAYYPYAATAPAKWTIPAAQDEMNWTEYDLCSATVTGVKPSNRAVTLLFNHLMAKVTVDLTVSGAGLTTEEKDAVKAELVAALSANVDMRTGEVSEVAEPASITLTEDNTALVVPQTIAQGAKIATLATENGDIDVVAGKDIVFEAGKNNIVKISLSIDNYISVKVTCTIADWNTGSSMELTKPVVGGVENLSKEGVANCYIVSEAGEYSFATQQVDGTVLSGATADWVWMTEDGLLSNISYADNAVSFQASDKKGNGLIALLDEDGNIVWSWHIWCTDAPAAQKWNQNTWLDRNIGATSTTVDDVASYGLFYQWGRKDPIASSNTAGRTNGVSEGSAFDSQYVMATVVNEAVVGEGNGWANIFGQTTVENAARYPMCMYTYKTSELALNPAGSYGGETTGERYDETPNSTMVDWCVGGASDRWYNTSVTASGKTLNDPCPVGYMVPTQDQQYADFLGTTDDGEKWFNKANKAEGTHGISYNYGGGTVWLPSTGVRFSAYVPEGANKFIGNTGIYWNSTQSNPSIGTFISVASGKDVGNTAGATMWKSFACPVRCVEENIVAGPEPGLELPPVPDNAIDLSAAGTANCYVVNKGGSEYCFRADVKGNGAVTTNINPGKLAPAKTRLLTTHVAAKWFKGSKSYYGSDGTMSQLVLCNSVKLCEKNGAPYVCFETPEALSPGNAIIAVSDEEDNIIWSWHIWVTPDYELGQGDITLTANDNCNGVVMMDRNLGALANGFEEGLEQIQVAYAADGIVYQWGRKDPLFFTNVGGWDYGNYQFEDGVIVELKGTKERQIKGMTTNDREAIDIIPTAENAPTVDAAIALSIANPASFIRCYNNDYNKTWLTGDTEKNSVSYLWGNTAGDKSAKAGVKTIYDPCPVGYRVPGPNAFSFFTQAGGDMYFWYHYQNLERYNFDQTKTKITVVDAEAHSLKFDNNEYFGYYCYTNSVLKDGQTAADRTDNTTMYFPCIGVVTYAGNASVESHPADSYASIAMMSNALKNGGPHYISPYISSTGKVYFSEQGHYFGWPATACQVRCIKE